MVGAELGENGSAARLGGAELLYASCWVTMETSEDVIDEEDAERGVCGVSWS